MFEFLMLEIRFFETTSDGETTKTKVVDLVKLYNFVGNFFISNHLYQINVGVAINYLWYSVVVVMSH